MTRLKPCPFCGGEAEFLKTIAPKTITTVTFVQCINCGSRTRYVIDLKEEEYTTSLWNRRVKEDKQDGSDDIVRCPRCDSARVFELRIDSDWGSGIGNYGPVNEDTEYSEKDLQRNSYNRPDIDLYHCLECDYMWEPKE